MYRYYRQEGWMINGTCKLEQTNQHVRVERVLKTVEKLLKSVEKMRKSVEKLLKKS